MTIQAELRCRCGEVRGQLVNASSRTVNRVVCYCDDCQAFAHHLGRADLLDARGGSDIVQVAPASLTFVQGQHRIEGLRLTPKGLFRWYTSCCNTPVGNTVSPTIPFVGVIAQAFDSDAQHPDEVFGRPIGAIMVKVCDWRSASRLDENRVVAHGTRHQHGSWLALARAGMAASLFQTRDGRAALPDKRAFGFTARVAPPALRPASDDRCGRAARSVRL